MRPGIERSHPGLEIVIYAPPAKPLAVSRLRVEGHLSVDITLASSDSDLSFSCGKCDIVRVQTSAFTNPERGIKQKQRDGPVPDGPATFHRPHKLLLLFGFQCPWRFLWQFLAPHIRPSQSKKQVEIVQGG